MLVPIELALLSREKGYVNPEISLGWRVGTWLREYFDGLQDIRIAARQENDAVNLPASHRDNVRFSVK